MFDPYLQWMCNPKGPRPPTHYQLLGIASDERDTEVIKEAALSQTTQVRVYQTGPQSELCARLLNEIAQARAVLLNPNLRDECDALLVKPQAAPATTMPGMSPLATAAFENRSRPVILRRTQGRPVGSLLAALGYFLLVLAGAGASFWLSYDRPKRDAHVHAGPAKARPGTGGQATMKHATTSVTIEHLVELMRRSRVLPEAEVRAIEEGWPRETDDTADVGRFARWLVVCGHLTEYQTAMLLHGHASALFLGPYKLLDRIGKGSLAVVYRAVGPTGEVVALKVLPPSRARDHRLRAQFRNEAELACQLHHANVVHAVEAVLRQLLDRLLAKDPDARFTFPAEALAALSANVETMPAAASVLQSATVGPAEPIARIQLIPVVDVARPATAIPIAVPVEPKPTTTRLPAEDIASIPVSPTFDDERVRPPPRRWATSFWLAMLLGALILLLAQSAGWMLAYLLFP